MTFFAKVAVAGFEELLFTHDGDFVEVYHELLDAIEDDGFERFKDGICEDLTWTFPSSTGDPADATYYWIEEGTFEGDAVKVTV